MSTKSISKSVTERTKDAIFNNLDGDQVQELKDGYYGISDNIDQVIDMILTAISLENAKPSPDKTLYARLCAEHNHYQKIKELLDLSSLGAIL